MAVRVGPTPGMVRSNSAWARQTGLACTRAAMSRSSWATCSPNRTRCSWICWTTRSGACRLRLRSWVCIPMSCRRRVTSARNSRKHASGNGLASGRIVAPKSASSWASIRSVLASRPLARPNSRTCRGFTTTTGRSAALNSATSGTSKPPVASTMIPSGSNRDSSNTTSDNSASP